MLIGHSCFEPLSGALLCNLLTWLIKEQTSDYMQSFKLMTLLYLKFVSFQFIYQLNLVKVQLSL
jgi:hypothetical protein